MEPTTAIERAIERKFVKRVMFVYGNSLYYLQDEMEKYLNNGWEQMGEVHSVVTHNDPVMFYVEMVKCEGLKVVCHSPYPSR